MKNASSYEGLENELIPYKKVMTQAASVIQDEDVSAFPILILHQSGIHIGINIVDREQVGGSWSVNASTLEEFVARQLITAEKLEDFRTLYKSHHDDLCLFVVSDTGADFIFLPK